MVDYGSGILVATTVTLDGLEVVADIAVAELPDGMVSDALATEALDDIQAVLDDHRGIPADHLAIVVECWRGLLSGGGGSGSRRWSLLVTTRHDRLPSSRALRKLTTTLHLRPNPTPIRAPRRHPRRSAMHHHALSRRPCWRAHSLDSRRRAHGDFLQIRPIDAQDGLVIGGRGSRSEVEDRLQIGRVVGNEELKGGTVEPDLAIDRHLRMQSYLGILPGIPDPLLALYKQPIEVDAELLELVFGLGHPDLLSDLHIFFERD